jgi:hypothetical protein
LAFLKQSFSDFVALLQSKPDILEDFEIGLNPFQGMKPERNPVNAP